MFEIIFQMKFQTPHIEVNEKKDGHIMEAGATGMASLRRIARSKNLNQMQDMMMRLRE